MCILCIRFLGKSFVSATVGFDGFYLFTGCLSLTFGGEGDSVHLLVRLVVPLVCLFDHLVPPQFGGVDEIYSLPGV